ncbi:hypothetical protein [Hoeflea sp. TYP-13]|uniref:hypothetical protein n=1 Tax=Hoeflea sp. TYP-13 TaxID=3230023 RepID=UPI0034C68578
MAEIDWAGSWATSTAYTASDPRQAVGNNGSSYVCILSHTSGSSNQPGVGASWTSYWEVIAEKGTDGIGAGDMLGANNLSDLANAATARTNLGVAIGSDVQAHTAVLDGTEQSFTTALKNKLDGVESGADVTDTANVTAAGALMDSEVDADIKTLSLPANTTISSFGASLIDDAAASNARTTLGLGNVDNTSDANKPVSTPQQAALVSRAGDTLTGRLVSASGATTGNNGIATATALLGEYEVQNNGTGAAMMAFHRGGAFAGYFGLDTDNLWKVGGWSHGAAAYKLWHEGTLATIGQAEAEAGTATTERAWTAQRVKQAIDALGSSPLERIGPVQVASNSASINFTNLPTNYFALLLRGRYILPSVNTASLVWRSSVNNGVSWESGGSDYRNAAGGFATNGTANNSFSNGTNAGLVMQTMVSSAGGDGAFEAIIYDAPVTRRTRFSFRSAYERNGGFYDTYQAGCSTRVATTAINGLQLFMNSGLIATGEFILFGISTA